MSMSILMVCRLCLYNASDYVDLGTDDPNNLREKILKYLLVEIGDDDGFVKTVCQKCVQRLEEFHEFYQEITQNQEILLYSQPITSSPQIIITNDLSKTGTTTGFIQLPIGFNLKGLLTLQTGDNVGTFDLVDGATAIDFQQFVTDVQPDEDPEQYSTIEVIDSCPVKLIVESSSVSATLDDGFEKVIEGIPAHLLPLIKEESTEIVIDNGLIQVASPPLDDGETVNDSGDKMAVVGPVVKASTKKRRIRAKRVCRPKPAKITVKPEQTQMVDLQAFDLEEELDGCLKIDEDFGAEVQEDIDALANSIDEDHIIGEGEESDQDEDSIDTLDMDNERFEGFPKYMIKDSKLIVRGTQLMELMSKFYRLECDLCPTSGSSRQKFSRLESLNHHYIKEHSIKGYVVCCGAKLIKLRAMAMHMARHLQPEAFTCTKCEKMLTCPKILQYHMQNHLPEEERPLACPDCPRRFSYGSALVAHAISHQPESERAAHVCEECGKIFVSAGRLTTHIQVSHTSHGQDYICHICAKQFACRSNLTYHLTTHQPRVHQVQCEECGKWLKNKLCLRKHMVQHSTVRYSCTECDYSALNRQCLRNHIKVQHSDLKSFACEVCAKTFKLKNTLLNHMAQHTGIRKFTCPFCSRTFASSGNFYTHRKRMHPTELAAMKQKREDEERMLREQMQSTSAKPKV